MNANIEKLIQVLNGELGYLEKKSNSQLDDKLANAGTANFTKYARDMKKYGAYNVQGCAWCDCFADWAMVQVVGIQKAHELLGGWSAYTPTSASYYKKMNRWHTSNPQVGDQIFFKNSVRICNTGWVVEVSGSTIYTIEGNTSGASGVIANGGGVCKKKYAVSNSRIAGYGRPDWDSVNTATLADAQQALKEALKIVPGDATLEDAQKILKQALRIESGTPDTSSNNQVQEVSKNYLSKGDKGDDVLELQKNLNRVLNAGLQEDGDFGSNTEKAVKEFQKKYGLTVDGEYGKNSKTKMAEVIASLNNQAAASQPNTTASVIAAGQLHANNFTGCGLQADGKRGPLTVKGGVKVLQTALNIDYKAGLVVDGAIGPKTLKALGNHYVKFGETQYLVTAVQILLMLKGYDPYGVGCPATFTEGMVTVVKCYQADNGLSADGIAGANTIKSLIS